MHIIIYLQFVILGFHYLLHNPLLSNLVVYHQVHNLTPKSIACLIFITAVYFVRRYVGSHVVAVENVFQTGKFKHLCNLRLEKACITDRRTSFRHKQHRYGEFLKS